MSRHWTGESDDPLDWGRYTAALRSSIRGRRGQRLLRDLIDGLEALPEPELDCHELASHGTGCVCAFRAVALHRGESFDDLADAETLEPSELAERYDVSSTLANEIVQLNDEIVAGGSHDVIQRRVRWRKVHAWALANLSPAPEKGHGS